MPWMETPCLRRLLQPCIILVMTWIMLPDKAHAQTYGNLFSKETIYKLEVQGFRLGMTDKDIVPILKKNGWQGRWKSPTDPFYDFPFTNGNSSLYIQRCADKDKIMRLCSVVDKQSFERPHFDHMPMNRAIGDIWMETVIDQFGPSSMEFSNSNGLNAYVYYLMDFKKRDLPKLEVYLNGFEATYELTDLTMFPH